MIDKLYGFQVNDIGELIVLDVTDPADIIIKSRLALAGSNSPVIAKDGYLYVIDNTNGKLYVLDISDIENISIVGTHTDSHLINAVKMCISGNWLFVAAGVQLIAPPFMGQLLKIDISNKANPIGKGIISLPGLMSISAYGDYLCVLKLDSPTIPSYSILCIYDQNFVLKDSLSFAYPTGLALDCARDGDHCCVTTFDGSFPIVNVTDPENIALSSNNNIFAGLAYGIIKDGNFCYVALPSGELDVVDVIDPTDPAVVGSLTGLGVSMFVFKYGNYCYISGLGFSIVDISTPDSPSLAGSLAILGGNTVVVFYPAAVPYSFEEIGTGISTGGEIEGYLTVLNDDRIVGLLELPPMAVEGIIELLLDYSSAHVAGTLLFGGIDTALNKTLEMSFNNKTILACILDIVKIIGGYLTVRHDPADPHVRYLYLEELEDDLGQEVRIGKNLKSIKKAADFSALCTRMVPLGDGEGNDQLNLTLLNVANETATHLIPDDTYGYIKLGTVAAGTLYRCYKDWTAEGEVLPSHITIRKDTVDDTSNWVQGPDARQLRCDIGDYDVGAVYDVSYQHAYYLIADTYDTYRQITKDYTVKGIVSVNDLMIAAVTELPRRSVPQVAYTIGAIDLSELIGRASERLDIGSLAHVVDEGISINVAVPVLAIKKRSLREPSDTDFTFSNFPSSIAIRLAQQQENIDAINNQSITGTSTVIPYNATIPIDHEAGYHPVNFKFEISDTFIRCNKVGFTFLEDAGPSWLHGSETLDFDVTVDGSVIGHDIKMVDVDITLYLTTPILGTEHKITWEFHTLPGTNGCYLHITVNAQVFRRSKPLF
jgi:hypothetical protein